MTWKQSDRLKRSYHRQRAFSHSQKGPRDRVARGKQQKLLSTKRQKQRNRQIMRGASGLKQERMFSKTLSRYYQKNNYPMQT